MRWSAIQPTWAKKKKNVLSDERKKNELLNECYLITKYFITKYSVWKKITSFANNWFDCLYNVWGLLSDPTPCVSPILVGGSNLQIEGQVSVSHI